MKSRPLVTLSIVSHGDAWKIERLLASIRRQEPHTGRFQLVLTDNLGNELPDPDPSPWDSLHLVRNSHPLGFARNHNQAFQLADGRYFAVLNPDLVFERPVFDPLIARILEQRADLIAPQIVDENGTIQDSLRRLPTPWEIIRRRLPGYEFEALRPDHDGLVHPDWMAGMFWLMESEAYRRLGGMDEKFRLYFEDVDFCSRARLRGMKLLGDAQVRVRHDAQRSSSVKLYYLLLHIQSAILFFTSPVYRQILKKH